MPVARSVPACEIVDVPYPCVLLLAFFFSHTRCSAPFAVLSMPTVSNALSTVASFVHTPGPPAQEKAGVANIESRAISPTTVVPNLGRHMPRLLDCSFLLRTDEHYTRRH